MRTLSWLDPGKRIWDCNLKSEHILFFVKNLFWSDVLKAWLYINFKKDWEVNASSQMIWCNSNILVAQKPVLNVTVIKQGLLWIKQLYDNHVLKSAKRVNEEYGLSVMDYNSIVSAIPKSWRSQLTGECTLHEHVLISDLYRKQAKIVAKVYDELRIIPDIQNLIRRWEAELEMEIEQDAFMRCFHDIYVVTNVPKYRSFQFRLLHRAVITNVHLPRWKKKDSNNCSFCGKHPETYLHLFIYCEHVKEIWLKLEIYMEKQSAEKINFGIDTVICNKIIERPNHWKKFVCLLLKQYIYRQRCLAKTISYKEFIGHLEKVKNMEKYIALKNNKIHKHNKKWESKGTTNNRNM